MTKLARLIFRLDFEVCTKLMNEPGTAFGILKSSDDFWDTIGENQVSRVLSAKFHKKNEIFREINFDPQMLNGSIEFLDGGIDIDGLAKNSTFVEFNRLSAELLKTFDISNISRAGIRFYLVDRVPVDEGEVLKAFSNNISGPISSIMEKTLGMITDMSTIVEGQGQDEILYRVLVGPLFKQNLKNPLFQKGEIENKNMFIDEGLNMLCDIDLYEKNLSFREFTLAGWSKTKVSKAISFMKALAPEITSNRRT